MDCADSISTTENAKDTLCRNVTIYGRCRYEDKGEWIVPSSPHDIRGLMLTEVFLPYLGCAFNHDPQKVNSAYQSDRYVESILGSSRSCATGCLYTNPPPLAIRNASMSTHLASPHPSCPAMAYQPPRNRIPSLPKLQMPLPSNQEPPPHVWRPPCRPQRPR